MYYEDGRNEISEIRCLAIHSRNTEVGAVEGKELGVRIALGY